MNILLIFFAIPLAVIIISIALQKILRCPALVAAIIFAIFLIVTFVVNNLNFLIATIAYTILSFVTAFSVCLIGRIVNRLAQQDNDSSNCGCNSNNENDTSSCGRTYQITNAEGLSARVNVIPNTTNGNTSSCCRRRFF